MQYATGVQVSKERNDFVFPDRTDRNDAADILANAKTGNAEYLLLKDKIDLAEAELKMSLIQGKPSLVLNAGTGFANGYVPDINKFRYAYQAGVTLNIPIYQGGRIKNRLVYRRDNFYNPNWRNKALTIHSARILNKL